MIDDDIELSEGCCTKHDVLLLRRDCFDCGGMGFRDGEDLMEEDPLWYDADDTETCSNCRGEGYFEWCPKCADEKDSARAA